MADDTMRDAIDAALDQLPPPDSRFERDRWRIVSRVTLDAVEPLIRADERAKPACTGQGFEQHQEITTDAEGWHCPACGTRGGYGDFEAYSKRLLCLLPLLDALRREMLDRGAVILVPTSGATGPLGTFMGHDVIRVPGLKEPMIGLPELRVPGVLADVKAHAEGA